MLCRGFCSTAASSDIQGSSAAGRMRQHTDPTWWFLASDFAEYLLLCALVRALQLCKQRFLELSALCCCFDHLKSNTSMRSFCPLSLSPSPIPPHSHFLLLHQPAATRCWPQRAGATRDGPRATSSPDACRPVLSQSYVR